MLYILCWKKETGSRICQLVKKMIHQLLLIILISDPSHLVSSQTYKRIISRTFVCPDTVWSDGAWLTHRGGGGPGALSCSVRGGAIHGVSSNQISSRAADDLTSWQPHGQSAVPVAVVGHTVCCYHGAHLSRATLRVEVVPSAVLVVQLRLGVRIRPSINKRKHCVIRLPVEMVFDIVKLYSRTRFSLSDLKNIISRVLMPLHPFSFRWECCFHGNTNH